MKTLTAAAQQNQKIQIGRGELIVPGMAASIREILALLSAVTVATSIVLLSVWIAGLEWTNIFSALTWGGGLVFLGLALDKRGPTIYFQSVTGLVLLVLAWLQNSVSPDFIIISGALLSAWAAITVFFHLR